MRFTLEVNIQSNLERLRTKIDIINRNAWEFFSGCAEWIIRSWPFRISIPTSTTQIQKYKLKLIIILWCRRLYRHPIRKSLVDDESGSLRKGKRRHRNPRGAGWVWHGQYWSELFSMRVSAPKCVCRPTAQKCVYLNVVLIQAFIYNCLNICWS